MPGSEDPQQTTSVDIGSGCPNQAFSIIVEDPDGDPIRNIWFIDPAPNFTSDFTQGSGVSTDGGAKRITQTFPTLAGSGIGAPLPPGTSNRLLTVVIADGEFTRGPTGNNDATLPRAPVALSDGGTFTDSTYTDTFTWVLTPNFVGTCPP